MLESRKNYRDTRLEFERHINILIESIKKRQLILPKDLLKPNHGIFKIRFSPNKRFNLNTINEMVRNMAMKSVIDKRIEFEESQLRNDKIKQ